MAEGTKRPVETALRVASALLLAWFLWRQAVNYDEHNYFDLRVYREGVLAWLDEGSAYGRPLVPEGYGFTYPPFALLVLLPFGLLALPVAATLLVALDVLATAAVLHAVLRAARVTTVAGVRVDALLLLGPVLWLEPVRNTFDYGQVNLLLLALVVLDAFVVPPRWRGVLTGIASAIKLVPAFFILWWLVTKQRRAALAMAASAAAATVLGALAMPRDSYRYWTGTVTDTDRIGLLWYTSNQSLRGAFVRLLDEGAAAMVLWLVACAAVVVAGVAVARTCVRAERPVAALAALGLASLLVAPVAWSHHWVWLAVVVVALLADLTRTAARVALAATLAAAYVAPHWLLPRGGRAELSWSAPQWLAGSVYPLLALTLLLVFGRLASGTAAEAHSATTRSPSGSW